MDVYGEMMDALYLRNKYVSPIAYDMWLKIRERMEWICGNWQRPGHLDLHIWRCKGCVLPRLLPAYGAGLGYTESGDSLGASKEADNGQQSREIVGGGVGR